MAGRGRGIDYKQRFSASRWAEDCLKVSLGKKYGLFTIRIGLSDVKSNDRALSPIPNLKVPDLLVFKEGNLTSRQKRSLSSADLPLKPLEVFRSSGQFGFCMRKALAAIEVEFSPYRAARMKGRFWKPKSKKELEERPRRHAKPPIAPNIWIQEKDLGRLDTWGRRFHVPIVIAHVFNQEAFAVPFKTIKRFARKYELARRRRRKVVLQLSSGIFKLEDYSYDRTDAQGAREQKDVYVVAPCAATKIGDVTGVKVRAQLNISPSQKYVTQPIFKGGRVIVSDDFLTLLNQLR